MVKTFVGRGKPSMVKWSKDNSQSCVVSFLNGHFYGKIIEAFGTVDGWIWSFIERYCVAKMSHLQNWYETTAWLKCLIIKQVFFGLKKRFHVCWWLQIALLVSLFFFIIHCITTDYGAFFHVFLQFPNRSLTSCTFQPVNRLIAKFSYIAMTTLSLDQAKHEM